MSTTSTLVSSADVDGTDVYGTGGDKIGHIDHLMIDKETGKIAFAVMHFGGFLGIGEETHPVPWGKLTYDTGKHGFVTDISAEQLQGAPLDRDNWYHDRTWEQNIYDHYAVPYYWI